MYVALPVEGLDDTANLDHRVQGVLERHGPRTNLREEVGNRTVLHDEVRPPVRSRSHTVQLHDGGVPRQEGHRIGFAMQFLRTPRIALSAHDLDGHVPARQLLTIEENVGETALPQGTNPPESRNVRPPHTCDD